MTTLLDIRRANAIVRRERRANIAVLTAELIDAQLLLSEIPHDESYTANQEIIAVRSMIHELNELIESERKAIDELTDATPEQITLATPLSLR